MPKLSEEAPLLVYHFWSIFVIHISDQPILSIFLDHISLRSIGAHLLTHFVRSLVRFGAPFGRWGDAPFSRGERSLRSQGTLPSVAGNAPFGRRGTLPSVAGDAPFRHWGRSLRSRGTLPSVAFATSSHSLRSFALVAKAPFGRYHSMVRTAVANSFVTNSCSVCWYCELRVCISLSLNTTLACAPRVVIYVSRCSPDILKDHEFAQSSPLFP